MTDLDAWCRIQFEARNDRSRRHRSNLDVDPESALAKGNLKFRRRFNHIERSLAGEGRRPDQATLSELEERWNEAKELERS